MEIFYEECPNCGSMIFEEDFNEGYCSGCGWDIPMEEAA